MWDGFNKRKFPRLNLRCELILHNQQEDKTVRACTENVGAGGLCVLLESPLERFSTLTLRLELDPQLPWIHSSGRVVWTVPTRDLVTKREFFDTGIEFVDLEPGHQELIRRYVESRVELEQKS